MYVTLKLDIKNSRENNKYEEMENFYFQINERLQKKEIKKHSLINLQIRNGDELFAVYEDMVQFFEEVEEIVITAKEMKLKYYLGVGLGEITNFNHFINIDAHTINGSSIWNASQALEKAKKEGRDSRSNTYNLKTEFDEIYDTSLDLLFNLAFDNVEKRTPDQQKALDLKKRFPYKSESYLYRLLKPDANTQKTDNMRVNFSRFITRSDLDEYKKIVKCIIGISKDQENKT